MASSIASRARRCACSRAAPWWRRPPPTITATSNLTGWTRIRANIRSRFRLPAGPRRSSAPSSAPASISAKSGYKFARPFDPTRLSPTRRALPNAGSGGGRSFARHGRAGAGAARLTQYIRLLPHYRAVNAQRQDACRLYGRAGLPPGDRVGAGDLADAAHLRAAAGARPVHASRGRADRFVLAGLQHRALARRQIFLEPARPRIHADVDDRGVLFSRARRGSVFARQPHHRPRILTDFVLAMPMERMRAIV